MEQPTERCGTTQVLQIKEHPQWYVCKACVNSTKGWSLEKTCEHGTVVHLNHSQILENHLALHLALFGAPEPH